MLGVLRRAVFGLAFACYVVPAAPASAQIAVDATKLNDDVVQLYKAGRYVEAIPLAEQSLASLERELGPKHLSVARSLGNLVALYVASGRSYEAVPLQMRNLRILEDALGPDHIDVAAALDKLAVLHQMQRNFVDAEAAVGRALSLNERALGPWHRDIATRLINLGWLRAAQGRYAQAEQPARRALAILERSLRQDDLEMAAALYSLAAMFHSSVRLEEAASLYRRSLSIRESKLGMNHPDIATTLDSLAMLARTQHRLSEAESLYKRSIVIRETVLGAAHPDVAQSLNNLAGLYLDQGRLVEAEALYERSMIVAEAALGPERISLATELNNIAALRYKQGRISEAVLLAKRSLAIRENTPGRDDRLVAAVLNNIAAYELAQHDFASAAFAWSRAVSILRRRVERGYGGTTLGSFPGETQGLIKTTRRLEKVDSSKYQDLAVEMFAFAQWGMSSEAATSLAQMSVRSATGSPTLSALVRERQELVAEWEAKDRQHIALKGEAPQKRNTSAEEKLSKRLAQIDSRLVEMDATLAERFPDYASLASPTPISTENVQTSISDDEALLLFLDTGAEFKPLPEETFIWVVTKTDVRWLRSDLGTAGLEREVAALRCGLDAASWDKPEDQPSDSAGQKKANAVQRAKAEACRNELKREPTQDADGRTVLPFDHARAHALYKSLLGGAEDLIRGKSLLIVPSGPLTRLPFQVLVTTPPPADGDHRKVAWLARSHALTVLPAVSSLKALRRTAKPSTAAKAMIGFGNPLLDGPDARFAKRARAAGERDLCRPTVWERVAAWFGRRGVAPIDTRGALADTALLKAQVPLPETAEELCAVAKALGAGPEDVLLGPHATEAGIKRLSAGEGGRRLDGYRIVHFATHGTLAGQMTEGSEPGLILTPPGAPTETDDGYLSASEIAGLKLDADWVILSACNTAGASSAEGTDALSGLARAFFYAQARALLVSHWEVYSSATVELITSAVRALEAGAGRAGALQSSMLAMIERGKPHQAHPAYWAPFVLVGEGAPQAAIPTRPITSATP